MNQRRKDAAGPAHGTIGDHDGGVAQGISDLVMIPDDLNGIGFCLVIYDEADYEVAFGHGMLCAIGEGQGMRLMEHLVGLEPVVEEEEHHGIQNGDDEEADRRPVALLPWRDIGVPPFGGIDHQGISNEEKAGDAKPQTVPVDEVGQINAVGTLASWKRHDEIDTEDLGSEKKKDANNEQEAFHLARRVSGKVRQIAGFGGRHGYFGAVRGPGDG
jgi:hypothetical protein